jgi:hypothetical protein
MSLGWNFASILYQNIVKCGGLDAESGRVCHRYVRKHVANTVRLRLCPEIRFIRDDSIERGEQVTAHPVGLGISGT